MYAPRQMLSAHPGPFSVECFFFLLDLLYDIDSIGSTSTIIAMHVTQFNIYFNKPKTGTSAIFNDCCLDLLFSIIFQDFPFIFKTFNTKIQ